MLQETQNQFFLKMSHRTKLFFQTNVIECLIIATIMFTINVHPSGEDQVRQQFYWSRPYISLQGSSRSLAFVQILFGGEGASSSVLLLKHTFGHPHFSSQSWTIRKAREVGGITTVTSARHCHHHCLKHPEKPGSASMCSSSGPAAVLPLELLSLVQK